MAEKRDYYEVLGIPKTATEAEIKKAFRTTAKKYHPDMHPGDKECEEKFKEAQEAYAVLSDPEKRRQYDQFGHAAFDGGAGGAGGFDFSGMDMGDIFGDIFGDFFGGGRRNSNNNGPAQGASVRLTVRITFEEAVFGCSKELEFPYKEECKTCHGTGAKPGTSPETCSKCGGKGKVVYSQQSLFGMMQNVQTCPDCGGTGKVIREKCPQIGAITGSSSLSIEKKVILTMCADNGVVAEGVSQSGQEVTAVVAGFMGQQASSVGKMARRAGVDVIPVDIGINTKETLPGVRDCKVMQGTRDFLQEPAMTEEEALQALSVGIDLVRECKDKGYQLIGTGEMGIGNTTTSSMLVAALTGRTAEEVTGRGAGLNDAGLLRKQQVIAQALEKYEKEIRSAHALSMLAAFGGLDIAGMAGVCIGGALYHVPVVLDGLISSVAALVAERIVPGVREFVLPSHLSKEPAAKWIAEELNLHPVIDAGLGLGEGTGAVMLFSLLDLALALYEDQTTFDTMEIAQYERYGETE